MVAAALGVLALLGVVAGVAPLSAADGHWAITEWFLRFGRGEPAGGGPAADGRSEAP